MILFTIKCKSTVIASTGLVASMEVLIRSFYSLRFTNDYYVHDKLCILFWLAGRVSLHLMWPTKRQSLSATEQIFWLWGRVHMCFHRCWYTIYQTKTGIHDQYCQRDNYDSQTTLQLDLGFEQHYTHFIHWYYTFPTSVTLRGRQCASLQSVTKYHLQN